ncbi:hypothetical protein [Mycolicibacterium sp. XJ1819]
MTPIIRRLTAPLTVAVCGRDGVGRATVASALRAAGLTVGTQGAADVTAVVVAEVLKPEDRVAIRSAPGPTVVVFNKADLTGFGVGGPLAVARRRAADCRTRTGAPTVPMVALLAVADLDDELADALAFLVDHPADLTSADAFVAGEHPLSHTVRRRLLDTLDRFGIAHAILAVGSGAVAQQAMLRRLSGVDAVVAQIEAAGAPVRYRRLSDALAELHALAAQSGDDTLAQMLCSDEAALALMSAAVDVVEDAGLRVDRSDDGRSHLRRAVHWRRYGRGPVDDLHRRCAADICRGSLRLLGRAR